MAGKKDNVTVIVMKNLSKKEASDIARKLNGVVEKKAPNAIASVRSGAEENIGKQLQKGHRKILTQK